MKDVQFQLGAEVELFKTNLISMFDSTTGTMIVRQPDAGVDAPGMTIEEFVQEIGNAFGQFKVPVPTIKQPDFLKGVTIYLKEVFLLVEIQKKPPTLEFAIWISVDVDTSKEPFNVFPVKFKNGFLKVWNATNPVVREEMDIDVIEKLLPQATPGPDKKTDPEKK